MASQGNTRSSAQFTIMRELNRFFLSGVKMTGRPSLGVGAYGSVEPLELNGMQCAGKRIHDALIDVGNDGAEDVAARFVEECKLMSDLRHPHVVQFLGLCISPSSHLPILVMEHLYCSLDDLLETSPDIPLYMKRSILRDVALGLAHLHGRNPAIIHRDLTARNVLLNNNMRAKLADFGVARILNLPVGKLEATLSRVPGTSTYMPPEVFNREAKYNTAVDIFSFGHLLLFTITQKQPGVEAATYVDGSGRIIARSELERREDSVERMFGILGREHPFVEIVTRCLQTNALLRPTVLDVLSKLEEMRSSVRDPYAGQTRLTLTHMIRKKAAENKKLTADLRQAKEDLENAKKRVIQLSEQINSLRFSQVSEGGVPFSPTSSGDIQYYNMQGNGKIHDNYESIQDADTLEHKARTLSSPSLVTLSTQLSPPPPIPSSPRPTCASPEINFSRLNDSPQPAFLSLPRSGNTRHLSHENLHTAPDYMQVKDVAQRKNSDTRLQQQSPSERRSPFFTQLESNSDSDSDFDEIEPKLFRRSPQGFSHPSSTKPGSLPSPNAVPNLYHSNSTPMYGSHPYSSGNTSSLFPTYTTNPPSSTYQSHYGQTAFSSGPPSLSAGPSSLLTGPASLSGPTSLTGPMSLSTGPGSLSSTSSQSSESSSIKLPEPTAMGMAGKLHFYTDLDTNTFLLLQNTDSGKIPGVRYDGESGQVQIETDSSEKTKLASEKFRSAYAHAMKEQVSVTIDIPGEIAESTVEEIISACIPRFNRSAVSYNGLDSSLLALSFSGNELMRLKKALEQEILKASATVVKPSQSTLSTSGNITGKTRLLIKKGNLGLEDTDVLVFPNTSNLACKDGAAKAVDVASNGAIVRQCKVFITKHGLLGFGETILMKGGGSLKAKYVIHVNPGVGSCINLDEVIRKLVAQALKLASSKSVSSISFCPLVPTWTEANISTIAQTMLRSMKMFASERKGRKLRDIRIVVQDQMAFDCFSELARHS